ncbi:MAG: M56 family metallopeptidase, partial [Eubacteriales bacterium]
MNFFMYELLPSILNMSLIASYVIIFVLIARLLLKKAPKIFSYVLWAVVLVRLLCPFSFESAIGLLPNNTEPIPQDIVHTEYPSVDLPFPIINEAINENLPQGEEQLVADPLEAPVAIGTLVWGLGISMMAIYSIVSLIKLRRKLIGATPIEKNIYI